MTLALHVEPAATPPLAPLLASVPHFTPASIRANTVVPEHLLVLGGDAQSCATAQAYRRLGADVTIAVPGLLLPEEDRELVGVLRAAFVEDGIAVLERARVAHLESRSGRVNAYLRRGSVLQGLEASHVLAAPAPAARRRPAVRPWSGTPVRVVRTDPVLAHAGLDTRRARHAGAELRILRGMADGADSGGRHHIKATCTASGTLLGVTIVGACAFEHLQPWILALDAGLDIDALVCLPRVAGWFARAADAGGPLRVTTH
ncbi:MAG: NAD-binding protein [Alphaproteobacteria bacterium]|nr:NAD-binding protein [Alphaproteobacteria bacterium]